MRKSEAVFKLLQKPKIRASSRKQSWEGTNVAGDETLCSMVALVVALACDPCACTGAACSKGCFVFCVSLFCGGKCLLSC